MCITAVVAQQHSSLLDEPQPFLINSKPIPMMEMDPVTARLQYVYEDGTRTPVPTRQMCLDPSINSTVEIERLQGETEKKIAELNALLQAQEEITRLMKKAIDDEIAAREQFKRGPSEERKQCIAAYNGRLWWRHFLMPWTQEKGPLDQLLDIIEACPMA
jgi:hypothetical protein